MQNLLQPALSRTPDKIALRFRQQSYSYREFNGLIEKLANGLLAYDIHHGDRVAMFLPNCPEAIMLFLACYRIGAIAVPLNYRYKTEEANYVLDHTEAKLLVFHPEQTSLVRALTLQHCLYTVVLADTLEQNDEYKQFNHLLDYPSIEQTNITQPDDPALILYTSGSTGKPKGVVHSHKSAYNAIEISRLALGFQADDIVLVGKPLSHAGGLQTQLLPVFSAGGEAILSMKPTPEQAVALIKQFQVTEYGLLASDLLDFIEFLEQNPTELNSLKNAIGSGDAVPMDLHHRFKDLLGWEVLEGCGMTEVGCYYAINPKHGKRKWGSMGLPCAKTEIGVYNDAGLPCRVKEIGEFRIKTPAATSGYWKDTKASNTLFKDGWLLTGDLGYFDEDGYLWFVSRKKLLIVRRGSNISPIEIESIIDQHPEVHASVVVGIPDQQDGEIPVAFIAPLNPLSEPNEQQLRDYVKSKLADYKNPAHYLFFKELPRNSTGKFDRNQLHEYALAEFFKS